MSAPTLQPVEQSPPARMFVEAFPSGVRFMHDIQDPSAGAIPVVVGRVDPKQESELIETYEDRINHIFKIISNGIGDVSGAARELNIFTDYMKHYQAHSERLKKIGVTRPIGKYVLEAVQRIASPDYNSK